MAESDASVKTLLDGIFEAVRDVEPTTQNIEEIYISLNKISARTVISIYASGAVSVANQVAAAPEIVKVINNDYISIIRKILSSVFANSSIISDFDDSEQKDFQEQLEVMLLSSFELLPLESVLSIAIKTAIADNIPIDAAITKLGNDSLIEQSTKKLLANISNFSKYEEQFKKIIEAIIKTVEETVF